MKIHLEKNSLPGYTLKDTIKERRNILDKLLPKLSWGNIVKKLNVLYVFNKNKNPTTAMKFRKDMVYIQKNNKKHSIKKSKKKSKKRSIKRSIKKKSKKR